MQPNREQYAPLPGRARPYSARVQVAVLAAFLAASFLVAALGGLSTVNNVDGWYATADKAPWSPPNGVFGPVWTVLYPLLGSAALWLALAIIAALIVAVAITVLYFGPISRTAGLLLLPYVAWLVFASTLNWWAAVHN
jgi:tryptophan-rich sensory protein